ncbi:hypothetical protein FACS1894122_13380 [Alphaproteobacteria bacterium]|nr:hypothetical protein FACS1894122_13380 [Alphaproteobacteria bacterium]
MMKAETEKQSLVKLKWQLERVTFGNEENAYTVAKIKVYGYSDLVTIVGNIPSPTPGEILSLSGECSSNIIWRAVQGCFLLLRSSIFC